MAPATDPSSPDSDTVPPTPAASTSHRRSSSTAAGGAPAASSSRLPPATGSTGESERLVEAGWGTQAPYDNDSNLPLQVYSKLPDANGGYYKSNTEKPEEDKSFAVNVVENPDPNAALLENESSAAYGTREEKKKPEASHISSSPVRETNEQGLLPVAEDITMREGKGGRVENWACLNFSCMDPVETHRFLSELSITCVTDGMDFKLAPTLYVQSNPRDAEKSLWELVSGNQIELVILILPDVRDSDAKIEEACKNLGIVYQCCLPEHARMPSKQYLNTAAWEISNKVVQGNTLFASSKEMMGEYGDSQELDALDEETEVDLDRELYDWEDMEEDDCSEQFDDSNDESGEDDSSDEETQEDDGCGHVKQMDSTECKTYMEIDNAMLAGSTDLPSFEAAEYNTPGFLEREPREKSLVHVDIDIVNDDVRES